MAKILYGVTGQGSGHSSRSKAIIEHLEARGHKVKVITYGKGIDNLSPFFNVTEVAGFRLKYYHNQVSYLATAVNNFLGAPSTVRSMARVSKLVDAWKPDMIFTDFEPLSCFVGNLKKLPVISIDNQHLLTKTGVVTPIRYAQEALVAKMVVRLMIPRASHYLVVSFFDTEVKAENVEIIRPILRNELFKMKPRKGNYYLVYLTSQFRQLLKVLKGFDEKFIVYGLKPRPEEKKIKNIEIKDSSEGGFLQDLAGAKGVIANAGFSLISEALYWKKPYLALPVKMQFEQILNAYKIDEFGYGKMLKRIRKDEVAEFFLKLPVFEKNLRNLKTWDNKATFKKVDELVVRYVRK